ncbi:arginine/lysine/ornithine decarboxylase [Clostridiales Family XIII bacterium PM5-7]
MERITDFLLAHSRKKAVSFHMPGHKGTAIYEENGYGEFLGQIMDCDITEIPGADNLFQTEGIIKETMNAYQSLYPTKASYLLINGSSTGLIAAISAAVPKNGTLIMARNSHKAIFNGLIMAEAKPVYAYPTLIEDYGISGEITPEEIARCYEENPTASAVILPSPNYYGICSDIEGIAKVVHDHGGILIVDQAHGAHLNFFDQYVSGEKKSAESLGADIVINSTHKTLASFTQSAIVNLCSDKVDHYFFEDKLQMIQSTSPSYLLMASLDINASLLQTKGKALITSWEENLQYVYEKAENIKGLRIMTHPMLDHTKINLDMSELGIDGLTLEALLMEENIFPELVTGDLVMCMTGIGNKRCDFEKLLEALQQISAAHQEKKILKPKEKSKQNLTMKRLEQHVVPQTKVRVPLADAVGRVCASSVIPYPPGIPIICPGEVMDKEILEYVKELREKGEKVMGIDDQGRVVCGAE